MDKIHLYDKILSPLVTEKSTNLSEQNKIVFKVPSKANKKNIKNNIEKIFKVNVTKVGMQKLSSKTKSQVQHQKFMHKKEQVMPVSYTHLTLPTTSFV